MNKRILGLALPNIITNITVPLLGMVDMAIVGHLSSTHIGAITIGTSIFNLIYWNFGFLRMGTSGFTAQAFGAHRWDEALKILIRACAIALAIALLLIALQWPVSRLALVIFEGSPEVLRLALTYFFIRIWAAPATLGLYAIKGWFIGMQDSKTPMWIAIILNCVNIVASLLFVLVLHWDIAGVALGTVVANYSGLALGIIFLRRRFRLDNHLSPFNIHLSTIKDALHWQDMKRFFKVNGDIFLRTVCLSAVFTFITAASGRISDQVLAIDFLFLIILTSLIVPNSSNSYFNKFSSTFFSNLYTNKVLKGLEVALEFNLGFQFFILSLFFSFSLSIFFIISIIFFTFFGNFFSILGGSFSNLFKIFLFSSESKIPV